MPTKKTTVSKSKAKKSPPKKTVSKKVTDKKATVQKAKSAATPRTSARPARRGDRIIIDSAKVGSPPREGEILKVMERELSVTYQVKWGDGHETLISPVAGSARIVRK